MRLFEAFSWCGLGSSCCAYSRLKGSSILHHRERSAGATMDKRYDRGRFEVFDLVGIDFDAVAVG